MTGFNIRVYNDKILNVAETITYVADCLQANKDIFLFIDESPDLQHLFLGEELLLTVLDELCNKFEYPRNRISIEIENLVQSNCWPNIKKCYRSVDVFHGQQMEYESDKHINYKTSLFVGGSRWPRLSIGSYMFKHYRDDSLITYWQNLKDKKQPCYLYIDDLFKHHMQKGIDDEFICQVNDFVKALPLHLKDSDKDHNSNLGYINFTEAYDLLPWYNKVFCDVVCETVHNGGTFAFTEKSARCWMTNTPFLIFGPKNYLANIKKLGFQTFANFWDESYDRYDNATRIILIQQQIDRIHKMDYVELEKMYRSPEMQSILENNHKVYRDLNREKIENIFNLS